MRHGLPGCPSHRSRSGVSRVRASSSRAWRPSRRAAFRASSSRRSTTTPCARRSRASRKPDRPSSPTVSSGSRASSPTRSPASRRSSRMASPSPSRTATPASCLSSAPARSATAPTRTPTSSRRSAYAHRPVKQAVISASAMSLLYPADGIDGYPREAFLDDVVGEAERDIRGCLEAGAHAVQIDFTEGRLAVKLDPSKQLLRELRRPEQPRPRPLHRRGAHSHRRPHLSRGRPRLDAQRRHRLRRAAAAALHASRRTLLHPARERARPAAGAARDRRPRTRRPA